MDVSVADLLQLGVAGCVAFGLLYIFYLRQQRDADREDRYAEERNRREERAVTAAESQAQATADQAVAMTRMAEAMRDVGAKVEKLEGVVQGMREDIDELTPVETPTGKAAARLSVVDSGDPPKHQPPAGGRHSSHKDR